MTERAPGPTALDERFVGGLDLHVWTPGSGSHAFRAPRWWRSSAPATPLDVVFGDTFEEATVGLVHGLPVDSLSPDVHS